MNRRDFLRGAFCGAVITSAAGLGYKFRPLAGQSTSPNPKKKPVANMSSFLIDTFTDTAGTALTSHTGETGATWTLDVVLGTGGNAIISDANQLRATSNDSCAGIASGTPPSANYSVTISAVVHSDISAVIGPIARADGAGTGYVIFFQPGTDAVDLYKYIAGTPTQLDTASLTIGAGTYSIELRVDGSSISGWVDGVEIVSATDSSITNAGKAGVLLNGTTTNSTGTHISSIEGIPAIHADVATRITTTIGGDACVIYVPLAYDAAAGAPVVVAVHGSGVDEQWIDDSLMLDPVQALLEAGYIVAMSDAGGEAWGNDAGIQGVAALAHYLESTYKVLRTVLLPVSMGGLNGLNAVASKRIASLTGVYLPIPVCSLLNAYDGADGGQDFSSNIDTAYSISGDYGAKTAGHDPLLVTQSLFKYWRSLRFRFSLSDEDTVVPRTAHGDLMVARLTGYARSVSVFEASGEHGDPSQFNADDIVDFCDSCTVVSVTDYTIHVAASA